MRSGVPSSRITRAEPSIWIASTSSGSLSQQISSFWPSSAPASIAHELVLLVEGTVSTFVWKCIGAWLVAGGDEIGRATVEWDTEHGARKARALNDRFKITGQNTLGLAQACHA